MYIKITLGSSNIDHRKCEKNNFFSINHNIKVCYFYITKGIPKIPENVEETSRYFRLYKFLSKSLHLDILATAISALQRATDASVGHYSMEKI